MVYINDIGRKQLIINDIGGSKPAIPTETLHDIIMGLGGEGFTVTCIGERYPEVGPIELVVHGAEEENKRILDLIEEE